MISQTQSSGRGSSTQSVPVYRLKSVGTVPCDGVCESVVYSSPCIVRSTCCWKLDWDELETNQQHFQALCYHLREKVMGGERAEKLNGAIGREGGKEKKKEGKLHFLEPRPSPIN